MLLALSIGLAVIYILIKPTSDGLMNTSMWVSKMLAPTDAEDGDTSKQFLKMGQAALMDGWLSNIPFIATILLLSSVIAGFLYSWWAGIVVIVLMAFLGTLSSLIFMRSVTYYLSFLAHKMLNRAADYRKKQDFERYEAAESYNKDLMDIMAIYHNSRLKPPTEKQLKNIPYGDLYYWLTENN